MKSYFVYLTLILFVSLSSCKTNQNISLGDVKVDDTITVIMKDSVKVDLVSNPSTGFKWKYVENSSEKNAIFVNDVYVAPESQLMGAAGTQTFVFFAKKKGSTVLNFDYARGQGTPTKTHSVWVIVKKK